MIGAQPVPRRGWWMRLRPLRWLAAGYLGVAVLAMFLEESLIFFPTRYPDGQWNPAGLAVEDAWFRAADGTKLHGWYIDHPDPCAVVLFSHGNGGNLSGRDDVLRVLHQHVGAAVMIYDYRGYGRSEGKPDEQGILQDGRAARAWLAQRAGIDERDVVLMGRSLGGAVAVDLAAEHGARALVLESTFTSLPDVAAYHYRILPVRWLMRSRLDSASKIDRYHGPLLASHGEADTIVPFALGRRLFEKANEPKRFIAFAGDDHNDQPPPEYYDTLRAFLAELP